MLNARILELLLHCFRLFPGSMSSPVITSDSAGISARRAASHARAGVWGHVKAKLAEQGVGGVLSAVARLFGVLWTWRSHQALVSVVKQPRTQALRSAFPTLVYRYTLPYLSNHLVWDARREALRSHYEFVNHVFDDDFSLRVLADCMEIWCQEFEGQRLAVSVQGLCPVTKHREGELTLCFRMDGRPLYKLSFSIVAKSALPQCLHTHACQDSAHALFVGRVQGVSGGMDGLRRATVLLGDVAPQDVLMSALFGFADALGIRTLIGVGDDACVSRDDIERSSSNFSYDQFWARYGGQHVDGAHHILMLPILDRPIGDIAAKHRKRTLRKRQFKRGIQASCEQAIRAEMA